MKNTNKEWRREYDLARYYRLRREIVEKLGGKCSRCGSVDDLEIDHQDRSKKTMRVSSQAGHVPAEALAEELQNCQVLCHTCHVDKSIRERGWLPSAEQPHGSLGRYTRGGCRCEVCCTAIRKYNREYRLRTGRVKTSRPRTGLVHGTSNAYRYHRCRCDVCRLAHNTRIREYLQRKRESSTT